MAHSSARTSVQEKVDQLKLAGNKKDEGFEEFQKAGEEGTKNLFDGGTGPWAALSRKFVENINRMEDQVCVCVRACACLYVCMCLCMSVFVSYVVCHVSCVLRLV